MSASSVALVAAADASRAQIARYLRDGGYDVCECEDLGAPGECESVVLVDLDAGEEVRARVSGWLLGAKVARVVVVSAKPSAWKALSMARSGDLYVLAAPAFAWEIVDALRAAAPVTSEA